jgi:hypothetical protein
MHLCGACVAGIAIKFLCGACVAGIAIIFISGSYSYKSMHLMHNCIESVVYMWLMIYLKLFYCKQDVCEPYFEACDLNVIFLIHFN